MIMKRLKHEAELFKAALIAGVEYAERRKAVEFESTDSASGKALYVYRLLVHDKVISPMPEDQVGERTIRHRLLCCPFLHQAFGGLLLGFFLALKTLAHGPSSGLMGAADARVPSLEPKCPQRWGK